jgi:ABC-type transport system involved in multi-copper enzyme maturation permease subunit
MRALAWKELREIFLIAAAALAWYLALVINAMGAKVFNWIPVMPQGTFGIPFIQDGSFPALHTVISAIFALALGFRQSAWESSRGTYLFLLHRPIRRESVVFIKLAIGSVIYLLSASLPILLYSWWAFLPGHHPGPFEWSMTLDAWRITFLLLLLYLGAFLSGLRPARWFGTRLLPLVCTLMMLVVLGDMVPGSRWWPLGFPVASALCALLIANICFVARIRDYA